MATQPKIQELQGQLKNLLIKNIDKALKKAKSALPENSRKIDSLIQFKARLESIKIHELHGTLTHEEVQTDYAKLRKDLLDFINNLSEEDFNSSPVKVLVNNNWKWITGFFIAFFLIGTLGKKLLFPPKIETPSVENIETPPPPKVDLTKITIDGIIYPTKIFNGKRWMTKNLNRQIGSSLCYEGSDSLCAIYGGLYDYKTALKACPEGWRLPTRAEWDSLCIGHGGFQYYAPNGGWKYRGNPQEGYETLIKDGNSGFDARLGGYWSLEKGFISMNGNGSYWTSTSIDEAKAYGFNFTSTGYIIRARDLKSTHRSCRCVEE